MQHLVLFVYLLHIFLVGLLRDVFGSASVEALLIHLLRIAESDVNPLQ